MKFTAIALGALLWAIGTGLSFSKDAPSDAEGLIEMKVPGLQSVHMRPGARLDRYDKVMLDPIEVAFSKSWDPRPGGTQITAEEKQRIQTGLERVLREAFAKELAATHRYSITDTPGEDVLRVKAEIRDLYINAPDLQRAGITHSYTRSVGEMTLVAELRDSPSGALIARVIDRARDPEKPWLELTTSVDNVAAAQRAASEWARILRKQLDAAQGAERAPKP